MIPLEPVSFPRDRLLLALKGGSYLADLKETEAPRAGRYTSTRPSLRARAVCLHPSGLIQAAIGPTTQPKRHARQTPP